MASGMYETFAWGRKFKGDKFAPVLLSVFMPSISIADLFPHKSVPSFSSKSFRSDTPGAWFVFSGFYSAIISCNKDYVSHPPY